MIKLLIITVYQNINPKCSKERTAESYNIVDINYQLVTNKINLSFLYDRY